MERVRGLLTTANDPAGLVEPARAALPSQAEHTLRALRSTRPPRRVRLGRRRLLAGAAIVGVGTALAVGGRNLLPNSDVVTPVAYTPPVLSLQPVEGQSAREFLLAFARRVERLEPEAAQGTYQYSKTWGWWLNTAGDVPGGVANAAVPTVTESWVGKDHSGRQRSAFGEPIYPSPAQRKEAEKAGLVAGIGVEDRTFGPGKFPSPEGGDWGAIAPFATDPGELAQQLAKMNWEGGMVIYGVNDLLGYVARSGPVDPRLRATALRVLADSTGVAVASTTTWNGRDVIAVSQNETLDGSTQRESVLFDPETGHPVGTESALFGHARRLNVSVPATLSVSETLERGSVSTIDRRP
ncbi:CU044_5270 family protein [Streptomyces sp. NPDC056817]|uniref:CU044_5270 family protein n=1 Tax=Streptomyces sp. NPDC056817 TaxID=3345950 RepID=UPI00367D8DEC